jgi:nucleotide-binding universal stress UspA family protein
VDIVVREGSPSEETVWYAGEESRDVVVMGTHSRSGVDRLLPGSVAKQAVYPPPCPC